MRTIGVAVKWAGMAVLLAAVWAFVPANATAQRQPRQPGSTTGAGGGVPRPSGPTAEEKRRKERQRKEANSGNGNGAQGGQGAQGGAAAKDELNPEVVKAALKSFDTWKKSQVLVKDMVIKGQWSGIDKAGKKHDVDFELQWRKDGAGWSVVFLQARPGDVPPAASLGIGPVPWTFNWYGYLPEEKKLTGPKTELPRVFADDNLQIADLLPLDFNIYDSVLATEETTLDKVPVYVYELKSKRAGITAEPLKLTLRKDGRDALKVEWMKDEDTAAKTMTFTDAQTVGVHRLWMTRVVVNADSGRAMRIKWKSAKVNVGLEAEAFDPKNLAAFSAPKEVPAAPKK